MSTTVTLSSSSIELLVKLLGLCGSVHDGERANAALRADQLIRSAGLTWADLISTPPPPRPIPDLPDWRTARDFCSRRADLLRPRERTFVDNLGRWRGPLTTKQSTWLAAIYLRLRD